MYLVHLLIILSQCMDAWCILNMCHVPCGLYWFVECSRSRLLVSRSSGSVSTGRMLVGSTYLLVSSIIPLNYHLPESIAISARESPVITKNRARKASPGQIQGKYRNQSTKRYQCNLPPPHLQNHHAVRVEGAVSQSLIQKQPPSFLSTAT